MKKSILFIGLLVATGMLYSQAAQRVSTITIIGRSKSETTAVAYGIRFHFEENTTKCDPVKGFVSLAEQIKHFKESATARGVDIGRMEAVSPDYANKNPHKNFKCVLPNRKDISTLAEICREQDIEVKDLFNLLPEHSFADEDVKAVSALQNANEKAALIAEAIGMKVVKVLNIDDKTGRTLGEYTGYTSLESEGRYYDNNLSALDEVNTTLYGTDRESFLWTDQSLYTLRVTFEIE